MDQSQNNRKGNVFVIEGAAAGCAVAGRIPVMA